MTLVSEIERTELVNQLVATIGQGPAETLMRCVLPDGRNQLATKEDLRVFGARLAAEFRAEFATKEDLRVFGAELRGEMAQLRAETAQLRAETAELRAQTTELRAETAELRAQTTELRSEMAKQARVFFMALTAFMVTIWGTLAAQFFV